MIKEMNIANVLLREMVKEKYNRNFNTMKKILNSYENVIFNYKYLTTKDLDNKTPLELLSHAEKLETLHTELIEDIIPELIEINEYSAVESLTNISNRLSKIYRNINNDFSSFVAKNKVNDIAENLLKTSLDNGVLIALYDEKHRGTGKTTGIIRQANKNNTTIVVSYHHNKKYIDELAKLNNLVVDVKYVNSLEAARGIRLKNNKFIIDETVDHEIVKELIANGHELIGGFINIFNVNRKQKTFKEYLQNKLNEINDRLDIMRVNISHTHNSISSDYIKLLRQVDVVRELIEEENNK